jgi:hypothetical protein
MASSEEAHTLRSALLQRVLTGAKADEDCILFVLT